MLGRPIFIILSGKGLTFGKTDFFDFFLWAISGHLFSIALVEPTDPGKPDT